MSIVKKSNPNDLTADEIEFLKGAKIPGEVKQYLTRQHENIGTKVSAYRKVAAAARAEVDALLAVRDLEELNGEIVEIAEAKAALEAQRRRADALEVQVRDRDAEVRRLIAAPAAAVYSGND